MKHILSAEQFSPSEIDHLFDHARDLNEEWQEYRGKRELKQRYLGERAFGLFYEPSTRTRFSFEAAAKSLGCDYIGTENARVFSSAAKGETLEDTIRVLNEYGASLIVLRYDQEGGAHRAAAVSEAPIINAGDGKGEHPTQALLDLYTIEELQGRKHDLNVLIGGDLAHGRTARSLAKLLSHYPDNFIHFVSTPELQIGDDIKQYLQHMNTGYRITDDMYDALPYADVVYWTRLQTERLPADSAIRDHSFVLGKKALDHIPKHTSILHPLPRIGEITSEVDDDPRAQYFHQAGNGVPIRMALIDQLLRF